MGTIGRISGRASAEPPVQLLHRIERQRPDLVVDGSVERKAKQAVQDLHVGLPLNRPFDARHGGLIPAGIQ